MLMQLLNGILTGNSISFNINKSCDLNFCNKLQDNYTVELSILCISDLVTDPEVVYISSMSFRECYIYLLIVKKTNYLFHSLITFFFMVITLIFMCFYT